MCANITYIYIHTHTYTQKSITLFQIIQFCSGAVFTVLYYHLYFRDVRIEETQSTFSMAFTKGCNAEIGSVIREIYMYVCMYVCAEPRSLMLPRSVAVLPCHLGWRTLLKCNKTNHACLYVCVCVCWCEMCVCVCVCLCFICIIRKMCTWLIYV